MEKSGREQLEDALGGLSEEEHNRRCYLKAEIAEAEWWHGLSEAERDVVRDHADRYTWVLRGNREENLRGNERMKEKYYKGEIADANVRR